MENRNSLLKINIGKTLDQTSDKSEVKIIFTSIKHKTQKKSLFIEVRDNAHKVVRLDDDIRKCKACFFTNTTSADGVFHDNSKALFECKQYLSDKIYLAYFDIINKSATNDEKTEMLNVKRKKMS